MTLYIIVGFVSVEMEQHVFRNADTWLVPDQENQSVTSGAPRFVCIHISLSLLRYILHRKVAIMTTDSKTPSKRYFP